MLNVIVLLMIDSCTPHHRSDMMRESKSLNGDRKAGIEGLPLQLMILVVIAGVGTAVILGWMSGLQAPATIGSVHAYPGEIVLDDDNGDGIFEGSDIEISITVLDQKGTGIQGTTVVLEGAGISYQNEIGLVHGSTDSDGTVHFTDLGASHAGSNICFITVTVIKPGFGSGQEVQIPVLCG
jgi:hypothetical protein